MRMGAHQMKLAKIAEMLKMAEITKRVARQKFGAE
jgi:hypothetical protein